MYNQITLVGNLTKDISLNYSQSGSAIAKTGIATSHKFTVNGERKEETMFIDLTLFSRSAEIANQYLRKGSKVLIVGRLQLEQWTDQQSGQKRSKHSVIVETMQMLGSKEDNRDGENSRSDYTYQEKNESDRNNLPDIDVDSEEPIPF